MKRLIFALLLIGGIACSKQKITTLEGNVAEIKIDTVVVATTDMGRLNFLVEGAEMIHFEGLIKGAPIKISYRGSLSKRKQSANQALRIEVNPIYARLTGRWIDCTDADREYGMGISLQAGGEAHSIGMQTMLFKRWRLTPEGRLWLSGHSLGNGRTIAVEDEWQILSLSEEELTLRLDELTLHFCRESEVDIEARETREAAATQR